MQDWEIEDQKIFLLFLVERNKPFPPYDHDSEAMDFNMEVYLAMGTGKRVPKKTTDNISNLWVKYLRKKKEPEWIENFPQYRQFFGRVVEIYVTEDDDEEEPGSFELSPDWLLEKERLVKASQLRHKERRKSWRGSKLFENLKRKLEDGIPSEGQKRASSVPSSNSVGEEPQSVTKPDISVKQPQQASGVAPASLSASFKQEPLPSSFSMENRENPVNNKLHSMGKRASFEPARNVRNHPQEPQSSKIATSMEKRAAEKVINSVQITPKQEPQTSQIEPQVPPVQDIQEEFKKQTNLVQETPEILGRLIRLENLVLQSNANTQAKLDRISHTLDLLTTGLIGRSAAAPAYAYEDRVLLPTPEHRPQEEPVVPNNIVPVWDVFNIKKENNSVQIDNFGSRKQKDHDIVHID